MTGPGSRVAVITGASRGIGAGLVDGYRGQGWSVVANALHIEPSGDPAVLTVAGDVAQPATADAGGGHIVNISTTLASDVVAGILYLESAPFVAGEILHIDGGQSAGH